MPEGVRESKRVRGGLHGTGHAFQGYGRNLLNARWILSEASAVGFCEAFTRAQPIRPHKP